MVGTNNVSVARSSCTAASQAPGSNLGWRITVPPDMSVGVTSMPAAWEIGAQAR